MTVSSDPMTRSTRRAANAAAAAVLIFFVLWFLTTQVKAVRALSPFADDPWDAIATYAAIFLPFVAGPTWIRSLRHRAPTLPPMTAARIRWASGLAAGIVVASAAAEMTAILAIGFAPDAGIVAGALIGLVAAALAGAIAALVLTVRAARADRRAVDPPAAEPDVVDDLLALGTSVGESIGLGRVARRIAATVEAFLEGSAWSPRRHRIAFGFALGTLSGLGLTAWHTILEGAPPSAVVFLVFTILGGSGVAAVYLGTLVPLRLLRSPRI